MVEDPVVRSIEIILPTTGVSNFASALFWT